MSARYCAVPRATLQSLAHVLANLAFNHEQALVRAKPGSFEHAAARVNKLQVAKMQRVLVDAMRTPD